MLRHLTALLTIGLATSAFADGPACAIGPAMTANSSFVAEPARDDPFHTQAPTYYINVNASSTQNSEVADDIPSALDGRSIGRVRVYVAEWLAAWQNPAALVVNFYDGQCPPPADAVATYVIPWGNVDAQLVLEQSPRTVYMVDALIDPPFLIESPNSIGIACLIGWTAQPWTGVCLTTPPAVYGCGECYWSYASAGYPRWTLMYAGIGAHADLAYSLWEPETGVPEDEPGRQTTTWGGIKTLYR
jgi:hypothetical protein